jgi:hypothetical protein
MTNAAGQPSADPSAFLIIIPALSSSLPPENVSGQLFFDDPFNLCWL